MDNVINVDGRNIGGGNPCFIIAEIGSNHSQDINTAKKLIDASINAGADAVKFQSLKYDELYEDIKENQEMKDLFEKIELKEEWYEELSNYCNEKGVIFFSAPTYPRAVDLLEKIDVKLYKIASPQTATFPQLIKKVSDLNKPIIMSVGYCDSKEIDRAVQIVKDTGNNKLALLHCVSEYPTDPKIANLKFIQSLKNTYNFPVGFSDHTLGWQVTIAAVVMGADIIEKHITLSREQDGPDHSFALEPAEFEVMVKDIRKVDRKVENSFGKEIKTEITDCESKILESIRMKAFANRDINEGEVIDKDKDLIFRRSKHGIDAWDLYKAESIISKKKIYKHGPVTPESVDIKRIS